MRRRGFFGSVGALGAGLLLQSRAVNGQSPASVANTRRPSWMNEPGAPFSNYGVPSPHEAENIRWIAANAAAPSNGVSWSPLHRLEGSLTPNGLHFERHHNGVPAVDPANHRLLIHGLVDRALKFRIPDLMRYPMRSQQLVIECGGNSNAGWNREPMQTNVSYMHGLVSCSEWTGVPLATVLREVGPRRKAAWLVAEGADAFAMQISIPLEKAMDDALLALYQNGERVRPENGYPLRLIVPGWEGVVNVKWLRRLKLVERPIMARNETSRYTELLPSGRARQFTFPMAAKSLITWPHANAPLAGAGWYEISGIAWSGHGRVKRVEVSTNGGESWAEAALNDPVLPRSFTRFRLPWTWDGRPAVLQSRVTDETGYRQPTRTELVRERGRHGYFHYNAIVSWAVDGEGVLTHVYA